MTHQEIQTTRGKFAVQDSQTGDFPIVLLHGWPESSHCWEACLPFFNNQFRLIRPDLRGMGYSERTTGDIKAYQKTEMAQDIFAILDELGVLEFGLVGHDWGGVVAQEMTLAQPEKIKGLALMNISLINNGIGTPKAQEKFKETGIRYLWYQSFMQMPKLPEAMITGNEEIWLRSFLLMSEKRPFPEESVQEYLKTFKIEHTAETSSNLYRAMFYDMKRWQELMQKQVQYKVKGLYLYGNRDTVIIPEYLEGIENCFENGEVTVKEVQAGHFVQEEQPEWVAQSLNDFFLPSFKS